ncbi:MAG TPA: cell division protein FtsQ/DivIB [bacterium]|jgi:cell division septal protein FtsQ|nr:cell division protein FtsQ/DivIB [bacterium]
MKARPQPKKSVVLLNQRPKAASLPARRISNSPKGVNWRKIGRGAVLIAAIVLIGGLIYGLLGSPYFRASSVSIDGAQLLDANILRQQSETALQGHVWQFWSGNFWLASSKRYCRPLQEYNLVSCRLKRQWPNKLTLKIEEEPVVAIWQENNWYYWVDRFGRVVKQESPNAASAKLYPVIKSRDTLVTERQVAINPDLWPLIIASQTNWLGSVPHNFIFSQQEPNSIQAVLDNQQIIKLTMRESLDNQLRLWQVGQSKFAQHLSQAKVIDLRYGDRIIFQ